MNRAVFQIARGEFYRVIEHPLVLIIGAFLVVLSIINASGGATNLGNIASYYNADGFFFGLSQTWYNSNEICSIMAVFLGVTAISMDRSNGSFNNLMVKPLYRKDIILGKFFGLGVFLFIFVLSTTLVNSVAISYFYGLPGYLDDFLARTGAYIAMLTVDLLIDLGVAMLIGVLLKEFLMAVSVAVTYLSFQWFWNSAINFLYLKSNLQIPIAPYMLTGMIYGTIGEHDYNLFNTNTQFMHWLSSVLPEICFMVLVVIVLLQLNCSIFSKEDL